MTDKIIQKIRISFMNIAWKKILVFSVFIIISAVMWFLHIYNQTFETNLRIPVKYTSVPDSIIFTDTLPSHVNVRVKDYGHNMFRYYFKNLDTILIDVAPIVASSSSNKTLQGSAFEMQINKAITESAQILRYDPVRITLAYSVLSSRKVPVIFDGQVNLKLGYFLNGDIRVIPDSVMVYGTSADLGKLTYVYTETDTIAGLEEKLEVPFKLLKKKHLKYSTDEVKVYIPVEAFKQMKIQVPVKCLNLPDNMIVKFFPSGVSLSFLIGVSMNDFVKYDDFDVVVDYNSIKDSKSVSVPVRLRSIPAYVRNLTIDPPNVEFVFEYKDAAKR